MWTGKTNGRGYGVVRGGRSDRKHSYVHRWAYEQTVGPIPDGYEIDHTCFTKLCVNPDHLEAVTVGENRRRSAEHYGRAFGLWAHRYHDKEGRPHDERAGH